MKITRYSYIVSLIPIFGSFFMFCFHLLFKASPTNQVEQHRFHRIVIDSSDCVDRLTFKSCVSRLGIHYTRYTIHDTRYILKPNVNTLLHKHCSRINTCIRLKVFGTRNLIIVLSRFESKMSFKSP